MRRVVLSVNVLDAARARIAEVFEGHKKICVSFSGGKDSTVLLYLALDEARRRGRPISVLFVDWEAQLDMTIAFVREALEACRDVATVYWVCLPLRTTNACSQVEPEWTCWDPGKRLAWVREPPVGSIVDEGYFPFYRHAMTFEEFVPAFGAWFGCDGSACSLVGIRCAESLNRYRSIAFEKRSWGGRRWTTVDGGGRVTAYPIYDWRVEDVWTYLARDGRPYNPTYDCMHQAGISLHAMRICEPYGDEQRRGLWLYHVLEPETWGRVCARVAGANAGALYGQDRGRFRAECPAGHTWRSFAHFLLDTMPHETAEHYRGKIAVYLKWYQDHGIEVPDEVDGDTGAKDVGSWRRICKTLLKQDYWCKGLSFKPTKTASYAAYQGLMARRRREWGMFVPDGLAPAGVS